MKKFQGIFTVMVTAYNQTGGIDKSAMTAITNAQIDSGVHGLVILGSNGECPYLTQTLQKEVIDVVINACGGRLPVIVGINERGTESALEMGAYAKRAGADGLLVALPVFYPLDEKSVYNHYEAICSRVGLPVLFYNFPSHSHLIFTPEQIARISKIENVVGAKHTIFKTDEIKALIDATEDDFRVFTGICFNLTKTMGFGAAGAICPLPSLMPQTAVQLYEALKSGDTEKAAPLQDRLNKLMPLMAASPAPHAVIKEAMRLLGHPIRVEVKPPLPQLTPEQAVLVKNTLIEAGLLKD
jgi:4-hydroxy-tetrahydrodipicolinate synthase